MGYIFLVSLLLVEFLTTFRQSWRTKVSDDHDLNRQQSVSTDQRKKVCRTLLSLSLREVVGLGASSTVSRRLVSCYNYFRRALLALLSPGFDAAVICSSILDHWSKPIHF